MYIKSRCALLALTLALVNVLCAYAQLLPQVTPQTNKPPAPKPAQIVIQTSPDARVYLDDALKGQANAEGRMVIENPKPGDHALRVSLAGKRNHEQKVMVNAGQVTKITAVLADLAGTVVVQTSPGATVFLDGSSRGTTDATGKLSVPDVAAGSHELRISAGGKKDYQQKINVTAGQEARINASLADLAATLVIQTSPGAAVFLDGSSRGATGARGQLAIPGVAAGSHELRITAPGKREYRQSITVPAGQEARIEARLEDAGPPPPGTLRENPKDGLKYVWIPPGSFVMGCPPTDEDCNSFEKPPHPVTISKGFWIGQTEVTVGAYKRFAAATVRQIPAAPDFNSGWANESMPIVTVTWNEAHDYCAWAGGRLPTEAEWEYAARGGSTAPRYGPLDEVAWYGVNSGSQTHPVGEKRANGFGLYDVIGNALEWVNDWYEEKYYRSSPSQDPPGPTSGTKRGLRGGYFALKSKVMRVSNRGGGAPGDRFPGSGIRCGGQVFGP
ncbi:MAG TPA: SUMF1/EgtB/PvdO family nonheme iron enzyme [Terriglobia bacterium]|nr:SUMF1/EgtB/PvdO family nonheme iron enzyme [Terriglobia bacterium]